MSRELKTVCLLGGAFFRRGVRGRMGFLLFVSLLSIPVLGNIFVRFEVDRPLEMRLVTETGLVLSALMVIGTALLVGASGIGIGLEEKPLQVLVSLPIDRRLLYLGHMLGVAGTLLLYTLCLAMALAATLYWRFDVVEWQLLVHYATLFLEALILGGFASLLAQLGSQVFSFFTCLGLALLAHAEPTVNHLAADSHSSGLIWIIHGMIRVLPDLTGLDVRSSVVRGLPIPWEGLLWSTAHGVLYFIAVMGVASYLFSRREMA